MDLIGYAWLAARYGIDPVQRLRTRSSVGHSKTSREESGVDVRTYPAVMRPSAETAAHLSFALKHEGIHLEFLARLFAAIDPRDLDRWIAAEPTGQYARRAGFLYEWLTGSRLDFAGVTMGNYVEALDPDAYLTATSPIGNSRWRVRDNLPGTREFCPTVALSEKVVDAARFDCAQQLQDMQAEFGDDTLLRSAVWMTLKESKSSFEIERESDQTDRIRRFASAMAARCGLEENPVGAEALERLQRDILGSKVLSGYGLRRGPVFVGESSPFGEIVHYVAPHWDKVEPMLAGLRAFEVKTRGAPAVLRAGVMSFGFVFIHPLGDGNGRVSRFLINDTLRRDGAVPAPFILPVSVRMLDARMHPMNYDQVLELYSRPIMARYRERYKFGDVVDSPAGARYNFHFDAYEDAQFAWAYPDLTDQVAYMGQVIVETLRDEMRQEAAYLAAWRSARQAIKDIVEGSDHDIDRIIRAVLGSGRMSNKLVKEFEILADPQIGEQVLQAVRASGLPIAPETAGPAVKPAAPRPGVG